MGYQDAMAPYTNVPELPTTTESAVWAFLLERLAALSRNPKVLSPAVNENDITYALVDELSAPPGDRPFYFVPEPPQPKSRARVDLAARVRDGQSIQVNGVRHGSRNTFLVLEAKRLPTPEARREREYLVGKGGGIERFKRGDHGPDLPVVGMLGYIQDRDAEYWHTTLNGWICEQIDQRSTEVIWDDEDQLVLETDQPGGSVTTLRSSPLRMLDRCRLAMRHLWVQLCLSPSNR